MKSRSKAQRKAAGREAKAAASAAIAPTQLTVYHAAALKDELMDSLAAGRPVELDLSAVTEFDSAGVQLLMLLRRECDRHAVPLRISAPTPCVVDLLRFYNLESLVAPAGAAASSSSS